MKHAYFALPKYEDEFCNFVQFIQRVRFSDRTIKLSSLILGMLCICSFYKINFFKEVFLEQYLWNRRTNHLTL